MKYDATMLNIGREKQLFVDDLIIESVENVCRTWHEPVRNSESPIITSDKPWEHITYFSCNTGTVLYDPENGLFKCWYADWEKPKVKLGDSAMGKSFFNLLYAESEDGVHWRKPILGLHKIKGHDTNCVIPGAYVPGIVLDPNEKDENKRFKLISNIFMGKGDVDEIIGFGSGDGIHWTPFSELPKMGRSGSRLDDVVMMYYDPNGRIFIMNTRHYDMYAVARNLNNPVLDWWSPPYHPLDWKRVNKRRVYQSESSDFIHWTDPWPVMTPEDGEDDLDETFYGIRQFRVGSVMLGFLNIYHYVSNTMQVRLVYSRNGKTWYHLNKRQPFIAPRGEGYWDEFQVTITSQPIEVGDELYVYHGGSSNHHDWHITGAREGLTVPEAHDITKVNYGLGLAKLRLDGFCSLDAGPVRQGIFITRPVISDGKQLIVNVRCSEGGSIAVEVVNLRDEVLPGYSRQECDVFKGDSVKHVFSWKGKTELPPVTTERADYPKAEFERFRKIRFYMDKAELYSLMIT